MKINKLAFRFLFSFLFICSISIYSQNSVKNKYGLNVINNLNEYKKLVEEDSTEDLINLQELIPGIKLDIRYATKNNFLGKSVYDTAMAYLRLPAAKALLEVQNELKKKGLGLKIFDAYRPYSVTVEFYETYKDTTYVASAWHGSRHNRGCAVDLTLVNLNTGKELKMPTAFDDFTEKAYSNNNNLPKEVIKDRSILKTVMEEHGFKNYPYEWWHFDFNGWKNYELLDLNFRQLGYLKN